MRKFKVIKKWIGGPEVGTTLNEYSISTTPGELGTDDNPMLHEDGKMAFYFLHQIKGFVEEMKEPEEFWFLQYNGEVKLGTNDMSDWGVVPNWLRFPTKEHAQAFADFMKNSVGKININVTASAGDGAWSFVDFVDALNSRKHGNAG